MNKRFLTFDILSIQYETELKKRSDKYNGVLNILCCDSLHSAIYFILLKFYNGNPLVTETVSYKLKFY